MTIIDCNISEQGSFGTIVKMTDHVVKIQKMDIPILIYKEIMDVFIGYTLSENGINFPKFMGYNACKKGKDILLCYFMELLDTTLEKAEITMQNFKSILCQILFSFNIMHMNGIIHGDIKYDNILVKYYWRNLLCSNRRKLDQNNRFWRNSNLWKRYFFDAKERLW